MDRNADAAPGWTARGIVALGGGLLAGGFATAFLAMEARGVQMTGDLWAFAFGTALGHAAGGAVAGWALAGLFGRRGAPGWLLAALGGALVALLGGIVGSLVETLPALLRQGDLLADAIRVAAGTMVTPLAIASAPWLAGVWLVGLGAIHLAVRRARNAGV